MEAGEDGQVVTALVVMVSGIILAIVVAGLIPLGQATDESSQASNAADAAALGGATAVRDVLLAEVARLRFDDLDALGRSWPCSMGRDGAEDFAARNAAVVTRYCYFPLEDRIEVDVQLRSTGLPGNGPARARAVASVGLRLSTCRRRDDPSPPTTTTATVADPAAPPTAPPPPAYPPGTELRCRGAVLRFVVAPDGRVQLVPPGRLADVLVPRLIG